MFQRIVDAIQEILSPITEILPPVSLLDMVCTLAAENTSEIREVIGETQQDIPIEVCQIDSRTTPFLLYGFPDPDKAVVAQERLPLSEKHDA